MHTNYLAYIADGPGPAVINTAALSRVNKWVCRIHCHKVRAAQRAPAWGRPWGSQGGSQVVGSGMIAGRGTLRG